MKTIMTKVIAIDTEFTSFNDPALLSIGLVMADRELYWELDMKSDRFAALLPTCSEFVKEVVLTQFDRLPQS